MKVVLYLEGERGNSGSKGVVEGGRSGEICCKLSHFEQELKLFPKKYTD